MKAEELMVGDWVNHTDKADETIKERITAWGIKCIHEDESFAKRFNPIPITPEILETNGFSKNGNIYILQGITYRVMVRKYIDADYLWDLSMSSLEDDSNLKGKTIRYVHQLQHFMRDFEIEKEIELCN